MGGGGGGKGGGGTTVQQVQIPPEVLARYNAVNARAEEVAATPFQPYTGEFVAPLTPQQQSGIDATSQYSQSAQPYYGAATQATLGGMQNVGPLTQGQIGYYQNPYTQAVVDPTLRALRQQQGQQLAEQQSQAIRSGAFGGDRSGIARATLQGQQNLALGQAIAPLYQQGFNTAAQIAAGQQGVVAADLARQITGGQQLANLGSAAQQAALSGAQAQIAAGTLPQQTQQALDTAKYQQFMQEKGYPFQTTQFLANIAEGTGALSGNTTTQTQGGGFFSSDERDKTNIKHLGKGLYAYDYKDDVEHARKMGEPMPPKRVGPMAQDIEKKAPGLVFDVGGHKIVSDDNSMGGAVHSAGAFARGGYATQGGVDFGSLVAAQQAMYDANPYTGKKKSAEGGLGIPIQGKTSKQLQAPPMLKPDKQPNAIEQAMKMGQGVAQTGEAVKKISNWKPIESFKETFGIGDKNTTTTVGKNPARAAGEKMAGVGGGSALEDPMGGDDRGLAPKQYDLPQTAAQPPLQGIQAQNVAFQGAGSGADLGSAATDSLGGMGDSGMDFASALDDLGGMAYLGSEAFDVAEFAPEMMDIGDAAMMFAKRGGRIHAYADGGLVPRHGYAGKGFVTPGYDTEHNPDDIMDQVVEEGDQSPQQLMSENKSMNPPMHSSSGSSGGGGGGFNPMSALPMIAMMLKDGGRVGYAEGGGNRLVTDDEKLQQILSAGTKSPNELPVRYKMDDGAELRGSTMLSGPYTQYGAGLGFNLGGGRLDLDASRGSAPGGAPQYRGMAKWSKPFAYGGLVPREHHNGEDGNVAGQRFDREAVAAAANDDEPIGLDPRLMALASDKSDTSQPRNVRNNNPGNLEASPWTQKQPGYVGSDGRFAIFETPENGSQAMHTLIGNKASKGMDTPASLITSWASEPGSPPPEAYVNHVAKSLGIGPNDRFDASDPAVREKLASAMFQFEGGNKVRGESAPRPPKDVGPSEPGLGGFLKGKSDKGQFDNQPAKFAGLGDVVREYGPSGMPTSENFWMPALGFLGGMLASPNPKLLGAIGSGLVSGVSTQFELDKLNEDRVKNAYNMMKDRFEDAMQTDTNGMPYMMKRDKDTGKFYTPEQMTSIRANLMQSMGVNPSSYGIVAGAGKEPAKGDKAAGAPAVLPKPGETQVAEGAGVAKPGSTEIKAADPVVREALSLYPKPPEGIDKSEMTPSQLKANAFWNPKDYSLPENPQAILANIQQARVQAKAWADTGTEKGSSNATRLEGYIKSEQERLKGMLDEAVKPDVDRNAAVLSATVADANAYGKEIAQRIEKYRSIRSQLMDLANLQAEGLNTGYGAETVRNMVSLASTLSGGQLDMPFLSSLSNASQFDYAAKIAAAQIVNNVKDAGLQRAPAAGLKTEQKITPSTSMSPGAIHQLLGKTLGEMDYVHERDLDYMKNKNRWADPTKFLMNYDQQPDKEGRTGDHRYNKKIAEAFSQLPVPTKGGDDIPKVVDSLRRKYGETAEIDYGYRPKSEKEVAAPAASAQNAKALEWANDPKNANDPRAAQIKQRLGVQ